MKNIRKEHIESGCVDSTYEPKPDHCYDIYRITWTIFKIGKYSFEISWLKEEILKHRWTIK